MSDRLTFQDMYIRQLWLASCVWSSKDWLYLGYCTSGYILEISLQHSAHVIGFRIQLVPVAHIWLSVHQQTSEISVYNIVRYIFKKEEEDKGHSRCCCLEKYILRTTAV